MGVLHPAPKSVPMCQEDAPLVGGTRGPYELDARPPEGFVQPLEVLPPPFAASCFLRSISASLWRSSSALRLISAPIAYCCSVTIRLSTSDANCASRDRKSTRLNSSHVRISYAVFCLKKKIKA